MDLSNLAPDLARLLGVNPATLVLLLLILTQVAKVVGRLIPNDATGALALLRNLCAIVGADPSSRVTSGVTVQDVATQALSTPPIDRKVAAATDAPKQGGGL